MVLLTLASAGAQAAVDNAQAIRAEPLMRILGIEGTVRASFAFYNTKEEIDILVSGIEKVSKMF